MPLNQAHEGYEYQDLLVSYFILDEILKENDSTFKIDTKEYKEDKIDDLTIENSLGIFKKQIKYSNETTNQQLSKDILSQETSYQLHLDGLFNSWYNHPKKDNCEVRICLAWKEPNEEPLKHVLKETSENSSFLSFKTQTYKIDINKLWPLGQKVLSNWRRLNIASKNIKRNDFENFCQHLIIETGFPKQSPNFGFTGELENIILDQIYKLGIGEFPNDNISKKDFAFELLRLVTKCRSGSLEINARDIFKYLNVKTNYGSIEQIFPIDNTKNIKTQDIISNIRDAFNLEDKIILVGEPGSGKSWFIQNLQNKMKEDFQIIRHYCYTELKDKYLKDRIQVNIFYGNLINELLSAFPYLKEKKQQKYASNLLELNYLLKCVDIDTIIIIDGLDHIDRIFEFYQSSLSRNEIQMISAISKLQTSKCVKILVVSQPIKELSQLSDYKQIKIPGWKIEDIKEYLNKRNVSDKQIEKDRQLSDFLLEKSNGNPLYINYLTEEINKIPNLSMTSLSSLPPYSYNLKEYYKYLIKKLNFESIVPQVLSGANFSLSQTDLKEITKQGDLVDRSISMLSPVLKENYTTGGFIIYHESFRRFIIEKLKEDNVEIESAIFEPIIKWFESKGIFNFPKAYRFYFQVLFENQLYDKVLSFLKKDFVVMSIYYGNSFDAIKSNYKYLANSALKRKNFPKIVLANEINKVLSSTEDAYQEGFSQYLSALGHLMGFKTIADYLIYEGQQTLPLSLGIEACYLCNQNKEPAPWELYFKYFDKQEGIKDSDFKYYVLIPDES